MGVDGCGFCYLHLQRTVPVCISSAFVLFIPGSLPSPTPTPIAWKPRWCGTHTLSPCRISAICDFLVYSPFYCSLERGTRVNDVNKASPQHANKKQPTPTRSPAPNNFQGRRGPWTWNNSYVLCYWNLTSYKSRAVPAACLDVFSAVPPRPGRRFATPNSLFLLSKTGPSWTFFMQSSQICWYAHLLCGGLESPVQGQATEIELEAALRWASLCFMRQYMAVYTVYTLYTNTAKNTYILYHFILFVRPKYQRNLSVVVRSLVRPGRCFERATAFLLVVRCWDDLRAFMPCHAMPVGTAK